jgi:hypothetical protein
VPPYVNPANGLPGTAPKKKSTFADVFGQGESKADTPFTNPVLPGTTTSAHFSPLSVPGYTPDYAGLLASDPTLSQFRTDLGAQSAADHAGLQSQINAAAVQFGAVPDLANAQKTLGFNLGDLLNPETAGLASGNQFSTQANINRQHGLNESAIKRALAARHGLQSGELGYQLGQENTNYGQAQYDATNQFLSYVNDRNSAYAQGQRQAQLALAQQREAAASRLAQTYQPTGATMADWIGFAEDGTPLYQGPDGTYYEHNGSGGSVSTSKRPFDPNTSPPPPSQNLGADYAPGNNDPVPGYPGAVTNANLAKYLFGGI